MKPLKSLVTALLVAGFSVSAMANTYVFKTYSPGIVAPASVSTPPATYATLNPLDKSSMVTLSNGNLTDASYYGSGVRGTIGKSAGKWYFEVTVSSLAAGYGPIVGVALASTGLQTGWYSGGEFVFFGGPTASLYSGANLSSTYGVNVKAGDGTAFAKTMYAGTYYPYLSDPFADRTSGLAMTVNFGQNAFKYTVPERACHN
jgi:hypothetical protein